MRRILDRPVATRLIDIKAHGLVRVRGQGTDESARAMLDEYRVVMPNPRLDDAEPRSAPIDASVLDLPQYARRASRHAWRMDLTMFRRIPDQHFIDQGRVHCPVRKRDVDFDLCAGCRWSTGIDLDATPPVVRCRPEHRPIWLFRPWL